MLSSIALPVLYTLFVWWFSTGVILYLDGLPRRTHRYTMAGATLVLVASLYGLAETRDDTTVAAAYLAFTCTIGVWAWQEVGFLLGYVTGPRAVPCRPGSSDAQRFVQAVQAILYHEFALIVLGVLVLGMTWNAPNPVGAWTFAVLWAMRLSSKLNLFLGVRNLSEELLPPHLKHLATYFARRPMNLLFPFSVSGATIVAVVVWEQAFAPGARDFDGAAGAFAGTLLVLAVLEHWFLVLPLPANALWTWALRWRERPPALPATLAPAGTDKK